MHTVSTSPIASNLRAAADHLASYPFRTVRDALARLSLPSYGIPADLLWLAGSDACEAIEAELLILSLGWAA